MLQGYGKTGVRETPLSLQKQAPHEGSGVELALG